MQFFQYDTKRCHYYKRRYDKAGNDVIMEYEDGKEIPDTRRKEIESSVHAEIARLSDEDVARLVHDEDFISEDDYLANPQKYIQKSNTHDN